MNEELKNDVNDGVGYSPLDWTGTRVIQNTGRMILLNSEIKPPISGELITSLIHLQYENPVEEISLLINTGGGCVDEMFAMLDLMDIVTNPIRTIVCGKAMSAGAILAVCGTKGKRLMTKNSRLMFHSVSGGTFGNVKDVQIDVNEIKRLNELMIQIVSEKSDLSIEQVKDLVDRDKYLTAEEAIEMGLIDGIIDKIK